MPGYVWAIFAAVALATALPIALLALGYSLGPVRSGRVKEMPYESGMDPIHDTRRRFDVRFHLVAIAFLALVTADAAAQTNERIYEDLDFRFVTPGARAVGMGKTFVGLADDATAAESNPAGMSNLLEQEFSVEFIGTKIKHARFVPGGTPPTQTFGEYVATPSFLSYVLPMKRWTLSFFRHDIQDYRESFGFAERALPGSGDNFEDGAFGAVVCGFGIMFVPDRQAMLKEARRVLVEGGLLVFNVWDRLELNTHAAANAAVLEEMFPGDAEMRFRGPYDMHEPEFLRRLLDGARFRDRRIESRRIPIEGDPRAIATGQIRGTPRSALIEKRGVSLEHVIEEREARRRRDGAGGPVEIERHARVMHIVSEVQGKLRGELDALDLLRSMARERTLIRFVHAKPWGRP